MTEKLDILVVEDTQRHQESARILFKDHNLVIAKNYYEALESLNNRRPQFLLTDMMFPLGREKSKYSAEGSSPTQDTFTERPLGYAVALYATRPHIAVPKIAVLTDLNHHSNAISATFDNLTVSNDNGDELCKFGGNGYHRPVFRINNSEFVMFDERDSEDLYLVGGKLGDYDSFTKEERSVDQFYKNQVKNWRAVLDVLLQEPIKASQLPKRGDF